MKKQEKEEKKVEWKKQFDTKILNKGYDYYCDGAVEDMDIKAIVIGFFAIISLFILCNYLVTSINDGGGSLRQVFMIPAYGCIPGIVSLLAITLLSHGMTFNEAFLLDILLYVGVIWSGIGIFIGLMVVHDYSFRETVSSLIITAVFILIVAVISMILIIMWEKLWDFVKTVGKEFAHNVFYEM